VYAMAPNAKRSVSVTIRSVLCVSVGSDHKPEWFQCQSGVFCVCSGSECETECFSDDPECFV
jgi:hypothetical protein